MNLVFVFSAAEQTCFAITDIKQSEQNNQAAALDCGCPANGAACLYLNRSPQLGPTYLVTSTLPYHHANLSQSPHFSMKAFVLAEKSP